MEGRIGDITCPLGRANVRRRMEGRIGDITCPLGRANVRRRPPLARECIQSPPHRGTHGILGDTIKSAYGAFEADGTFTDGANSDAVAGVMTKLVVELG